MLAYGVRTLSNLSTQQRLHLLTLYMNVIWIGLDQKRMICVQVPPYIKRDLSCTGFLGKACLEIRKQPGEPIKEANDPVHQRDRHRYHPRLLACKLKQELALLLGRPGLPGSCNAGIGVSHD